MKQVACKNPLVSIIIPAYNCAVFISDTIKSIQAQSYENWELFVINDCSADNTKDIVNSISDARIRLVEQKKNGGAAKARNVGIMKAKGEYIAFLDSDDLWRPEKLEKQIKFMQEKNSAFCFTGYEFADENAKPNGKIVTVPAKISYKQALKNTTIFTSTVMFDMSKLKKDDILMPDVKSEDTATWWKVLKIIDYADGLNENLSIYRRSSDTLSSNKLEAIRRIWNLYRKQEQLNFMSSSVNFVGYAFNAVKRRV